MNVSLTPELENSSAPRWDRDVTIPQLSAYNEELGQRLSALDCGEQIGSAEARAKLAQKSQERRKKKP